MTDEEFDALTCKIKRMTDGKDLISILKIMINLSAELIVNLSGQVPYSIDEIVSEFNKDIAESIDKVSGLIKRGMH